jgi:hypothetical protein
LDLPGNSIGKLSNQIGLQGGVITCDFVTKSGDVAGRGIFKAVGKDFQLVAIFSNASLGEDKLKGIEKVRH